MQPVGIPTGPDGHIPGGFPGRIPAAGIMQQGNKATTNTSAPGEHALPVLRAMHRTRIAGEPFLPIVQELHQLEMHEHGVSLVGLIGGGMGSTLVKAPHFQISTHSSCSLYRENRTCSLGTVRVSTTGFGPGNLSANQAAVCGLSVHDRPRL
jgi:hypothetical protein